GFDFHARHDPDVLARHGVEQDLDIARPDIDDLHVDPLGQLHVGGLELDPPQRGGDRVRNDLATPAREGAQLEDFAAFPVYHYGHAGGLLADGPAGRDADR